MTWSSQGSVASFPSERPPMLGAAAVPQPGPPLTFRRDPSSGIVYVTGRWYTKAGVGAGASFFDTGYKLPAAFVPLTAASLLYRFVGDNGTTNVTQLSVDTAGNLLNAATAYGAATGFTFTVNALYFTDV